MELAVVSASSSSPPISLGLFLFLAEVEVRSCFKFGFLGVLWEISSVRSGCGGHGFPGDAAGLLRLRDRDLGRGRHRLLPVHLFPAHRRQGMLVLRNLPAPPPVSVASFAGVVRCSLCSPDRLAGLCGLMSE